MRRFRPNKSFALIIAAIAAATLSGCPRPLPELSPAKHASPAPGAQQMPAERIEPAMTPRVEAQMEPPLEPTPGSEAKSLVLADFIDVALRNNPSTKIAWAQAKASAASWAQARSPYYPSVDGTVQGAAGEIQQLGITDNSYVQMGVGISYLLLDFGGRSAKADAARHALAAANWNHNQAIQDVLRDVPQAYYIHLAARARVKASQQNLQEAATSRRATEERMNAGASTIADVLQARAQEAKAKLDLAASAGNQEITKGALATKVGWQANAPLAVDQDLGDPPTRKLGMNVDGMIEEAKRNRPDVGSAQAIVREKEAEMRKARALPFPKLTGTGDFGWFKSASRDQGTAYGGVLLEIPIFHGFNMENALRQARFDLEAAQAQLKQMQDSVIQQVWNAYQNYKTAAEKLAASRALLASAGESYSVSLARYRQGAADIVELLNAQATLADARAQLIDSKTELYTSYAELLHSVGQKISEEPLEGVEEKDEAYGKKG